MHLDLVSQKRVLSTRQRHLPKHQSQHRRRGAELRFLSMARNCGSNGHKGGNCLCYSYIYIYVYILYIYIFIGIYIYIGIHIHHHSEIENPTTLSRSFLIFISPAHRHLTVASLQIRLRLRHLHRQRPWLCRGWPCLECPTCSNLVQSPTSWRLW